MDNYLIISSKSVFASEYYMLNNSTPYTIELLIPA